jgi:cytidylate kinase
MGTVVFPDATLKIYLTASIRVRAERRYKQLKGKGFDVNLARIEQEVSDRDDKDSSRAVSPMRPAEDSILVDTSDLRIAEVVKKIDSLLEDRLELTP